MLGSVPINADSFLCELKSFIFGNFTLGKDFAFLILRKAPFANSARASTMKLAAAVKKSNSKKKGALQIQTKTRYL